MAEKIKYYLQFFLFGPYYKTLEIVLTYGLFRSIHVCIITYEKWLLQIHFFVQNKKGWVFSISPECWVNGKNVNQRLSFQSWEGALDGGWALGSGTRRESLGFWLALLCNFDWLFVSRFWHLTKYTSAICIKLLIFRVKSVYIVESTSSVVWMRESLFSLPCSGSHGAPPFLVRFASYLRVSTSLYWSLVRTVLLEFVYKIVYNILNIEFLDFGDIKNKTSFFAGTNVTYYSATFTLWCRWMEIGRLLCIFFNF